MKALSVKELISKGYTFYELKELLDLDNRTLVMEYQKLNIPLDKNMNGKNDYAGEEKLQSDLFMSTMLRYSADLLTQSVSEKTKLTYALAGLKLIYSKEQSPVHIEVNANQSVPTDTPNQSQSQPQLPNTTKTSQNE